MEKLTERLRALPGISDLKFGNNIVFRFSSGTSKPHARQAAKIFGFNFEERRHRGERRSNRRYLRFSLKGKRPYSELVLMIDDSQDKELLRTKPLVTIWADNPEHLPRNYRSKVVKLVRRLSEPRLELIK